jgi:integron integrase
MGIPRGHTVGPFGRTVGQGTKKPSPLDWAKIWHAKLARFHHIPKKKRWLFGCDEVIAFLIHHKQAGAPAWKRLKIAQSLALYKAEFLRDAGERLDDICDQLARLAAKERGMDQEDIPAHDLIGVIDPSEPPVIQQMRRVMRLNQLAWNTEMAYTSKVIDFFSARGLLRQVNSGNEANGWGLKNIGARDVEDHLTDLAVERDVAESTQDQAFHAILYLFKHVLDRELKCVDAIRSSKPKRIPTVMSHAEVAEVLEGLRGVYKLMGQLMYGAGLRLSECLQLRVKDIDFDQKLIIVRDSKGKKDRVTPLPETAVAALKGKLQWRVTLHQRDLAEGTASVTLPHALDRKYPGAHRELRWQFVFASDRLSRSPRSGRMHRHHLHKDTFPENLKQVVARTEIQKQITSHVFRHSFATHLLMAGEDIRTVQELLGHEDVSTTMIYLHCLNDPERHVVSPLDRLNQTQPTRCEEKSINPVVTAEPTVESESAFQDAAGFPDAIQSQQPTGELGYVASGDVGGEGAERPANATRRGFAMRSVVVGWFKRMMTSIRSQPEGCTPTWRGGSVPPIRIGPPLLRRHRLGGREFVIALTAAKACTPAIQSLEHFQSFRRPGHVLPTKAFSGSHIIAGNALAGGAADCGSFAPN